MSAKSTTAFMPSAEYWAYFNALKSTLGEPMLDPTSPSYTEARHVVEQKFHPDGEIDSRITLEITPDQDEIKMVVHGRAGSPQVIYMTIETADALNTALVHTIDQLESYIDRDNEYFLPKEDDDAE